MLDGKIHRPRQRTDCMSPGVDLHGIVNSIGLHDLHARAQHHASEFA
jgi:hypothetical protein